MESITLGGGCFWCIEGVFSQIKGVISTEIGYGGGNHCNPTYQSVTANPDGHAELTIVIFDPKILSLHYLLDVFYKIHNPQKRYVINDKKGELYRSIILFKDLIQKQAILDYIELYERRLNCKVKTEVSMFRNFSPAADKYQNYYASNPEKPFCENVILPKIKKIQL